MQFGCFASLALWLVLASLVLGSAVPVATGLVIIAGLIIFRGLRSDWPLY